MNDSKKILVMLTGGTICSAVDKDGKRYSEASKINIINEYKKGPSPCAKDLDFDTVTPTDILSENMTTEKWNEILNTFRNIDTKEYIGVIVLHGTDTLGFTAPLLSVALAGFSIPVMLVSAQLPLSENGTNGHHNFKVAAELISNGIRPNVYAVYRNSDGVTYLHQGAHLEQCENFSDDFFSRTAKVIENTENAKLEGVPFKPARMLLSEMGELKPSVLCITPYVGLDYELFRLDKIKAVLHGTYHTESVCVDRSRGVGDVTDFSIIKLSERCKESEVDLFLAPCSAAAFCYESTGDAIKHGARPIAGQNFQTAYVKLLVGHALGLCGDLLQKFVNSDINYEKL